MQSTRRLSYEPLGPHHGSLLFDVLAADEVWRHLAPPEARSPQELAARFARQAAGPQDVPGERWVNLALRLGPDGPYCGRLEATIHPEGWAEIAYLLGPAFWGQGLASEAVAWLRERLLAEYAVSELWAATRPGNGRSRRLLLRLGFQESPALRSLCSADEHDLLYRWLQQ